MQRQQRMMKAASARTWKSGPRSRRASAHSREKRVTSFTSSCEPAARGGRSGVRQDGRTSRACACVRACRRVEASEKKAGGGQRCRLHPRRTLADEPRKPELAGHLGEAVVAYDERALLRQAPLARLRAALREELPAESVWRHRTREPCLLAVCRRQIL